MKKLTYCFIGTIFLLPSFWVTMATAETDFLNLDAYLEGDMPSYGENIVVKQDEKTGIKWISEAADAISSGTLKFPVNLSGDFELFIEINSYAREELFLTSDEYKVKLRWNSSGLSSLSAGKDSANVNQSGAAKGGINKIRFLVVNNVAKVYMNDVFDGKITLKPDLVYAQLMIQEISEYTKIYTLKLDGSTSTGTPTTTDGTPNCPTPTDSTPTSSGDCMATYSINGQVHIPCISVPDAFGGTTVYEVKMQQQPGAMAFDIDLNSIKLR